MVPDARDREREWARIQNVSVIILFQLNIFSTTHKQQTSTKGSEMPLGHTQSDVDYRRNGDDADGGGVASCCTWLRWYVTFSFRWCPVVRSRCLSPSLSLSLTYSLVSLTLSLALHFLIFIFIFILCSAQPLIVILEMTRVCLLWPREKLKSNLLCKLFVSTLFSWFFLSVIHVRHFLTDFWWVSYGQSRQRQWCIRHHELFNGMPIKVSFGRSISHHFINNESQLDDSIDGNVNGIGFSFDGRAFSRICECVGTSNMECAVWFEGDQNKL